MVTGIVSKVFERQAKGKTFYSLGLVNDKIYGFSVKNPKANVGDRVSFEAHENERGYMEADWATLRVEAAPKETVQYNPSAARASAQGGKDDYWTRKEGRDLQNDKDRSTGAARNTAIEWITFLIAQEAYKLPPATKREEFFNALLDDYTERFKGGVPEAAVEAAPSKADPEVNEAPVGEEWN